MTTGTNRKPTRVRIADAGDSIRRREAFVAGDGSLSGGTLGRHPADAGRLPADVFARFDAAARSTGPLYVVSSYGTPIAWAGPGEPLTVPDVRYSVTTSRHQGIARRADAPVPTVEDYAAAACILERDHLRRPVIRGA